MELGAQDKVGVEGGPTKNNEWRNGPNKSKYGRGAQSLSMEEICFTFFFF